MRGASVLILFSLHRDVMVQNTFVNFSVNALLTVVLSSITRLTNTILWNGYGGKYFVNFLCELCKPKDAYDHLRTQVLPNEEFEFDAACHFATAIGSNLVEPRRWQTMTTPPPILSKYPNDLREGSQDHRRQTALRSGLQR
jgi:hypothetical protein